MLALEKLPADKDKPNDAKWKIVESTGAAPRASDALDEQQANLAVQGMASLHASDFADDMKKDETKKDEMKQN